MHRLVTQELPHFHAAMVMVNSLSVRNQNGQWSVLFTLGVGGNARGVGFGSLEHLGSGAAARV